MKLVCGVVCDICILSEHLKGLGELIRLGRQLENMSVHVAGVSCEAWLVGIAPCTVGLVLGWCGSQRGGPFGVVVIGVGGHRGSYMVC